jgi:hypothetical protein
MEHETHKAGTQNNCTECRELVYEPSWYAALVAFEQDLAVIESGVGVVVRAGDTSLTA